MLDNIDQFQSCTSSTFRDPQGKLYRDGDRIFREINPQHNDAVLSWIQSSLARRWVEQCRLVPTEILTPEPGQPLILEHERIFFPSYPWEWCPGQWISAGSMTLDLCEEALENGYILKDATPLNILFSGSKPVFIDVLSFEKRDLKSPIWIAYAQFVRTFLLPLAAYIHLGWPLAATQQYRDGYEPSNLAPWLGFFKRWRSPLRSLVTLPMLLEDGYLEKKSHTQAFRHQVSEELSVPILRNTLRSARKLLLSLTPPEHKSRWSGYTQTACHYKQQDHTAKQEFVRRKLEQIKPVSVLDVGANTGVYSRIASECGANVVAWDPDVRATDVNWQAASRGGLSILPLVADFARPTPAVGWRNSECESLLSRAKGRFDCVMMLGVLHHLLIAEQIPLISILDQVAEISTRWAVLEWIPQQDSQFAGLCRGREELYAQLTEEYFVQLVNGRFAVRDRELLSNGRTLWLVETSK